MKFFTTLIAAIAFVLCTTGKVTFADHLDFIYQGEMFTVAEGDFFNTSSHIVARLSFNNVGDPSASSMDISVLSNGQEQLTVSIFDAFNTDPEIDVLRNEAVWSESELSGFSSDIVLDVNSNGYEEQLSFSNLLGDIVLFDFLGPEQSSGASFTPGTLTAVPETSAAIALLVGTLLIPLRRKREHL